MKVGIGYFDNDFWATIQMFFKLYVDPTFKDIGDGHMVTHLTSSMIVDLFNTYAVHCYKYLREESEDRRLRGPMTETEFIHLKAYLNINESQVHWDGKLDEVIELYEHDGVYWTDGKLTFN